MGSPAYDCLIYNALVLTMAPGAGPLAHGYVAVAGGKITAVGQADALQDLPAARERLDAQGGLLLPGLVNTHCHAPMVWFRGLADDLPLQQWLTEFIFPAEGAWLDADKVYRGTLLAAAEMIRGGITTVADGYFFEAAVRQALSDAGLRAVVAQGVVDFPAPGVPDPARNLAVAAEFLDTGADYRGPAHLRGLLPLPLYLWARDPAKGQGLDPGTPGAVFSPPGGNPGGSGRPQGPHRPVPGRLP